LPHAVVAYAVTVSPYRVAVARELLNSGAPEVVYGALEGLRADPALAKDLISLDWLNERASSSDWRGRALAATAVGVRGDEGFGFLILIDYDDGFPSHFRHLAIKGPKIKISFAA